MGDCKDCKHWDKTIWSSGADNASSMDYPEDRICLRITMGRRTYTELAVVESNWYEEPERYLITQADFGCVLFEAREVIA